MLEVLSPAFVTTIQDGGRHGYQRYGVPLSGPMDWFAHRAANCLVGNLPEAACLELGMSGAQLRLKSDALVAITGAGYRLLVNGKALPIWTALWLHRGAHIEFSKVPGGTWAYLAVAGGFQEPQILGSCSTYLRAGIGRRLQPCDILSVSGTSASRRELAGRYLPEDAHPAYGAELELMAIPGPHIDCFSQSGLESFWNETYKLTPKADRMGYRLKGIPLTHSNGADIISQGMVSGTVQVPADGQPMVMMPDHPTSGGYTQVAVLATADLPRLAQCEPGIGRLRFRRVDVEEAQEVYRKTLASLEAALLEDQEDWMLL